jgi:hypothetical protein
VWPRPRLARTPARQAVSGSSRPRRRESRTASAAAAKPTAQFRLRTYATAACMAARRPASLDTRALECRTRASASEYLLSALATRPSARSRSPSSTSASHSAACRPASVVFTSIPGSRGALPSGTFVDGASGASGSVNDDHSRYGTAFRADRTVPSTSGCHANVDGTISRDRFTSHNFPFTRRCMLLFVHPPCTSSPATGTTGSDTKISHSSWFHFIPDYFSRQVTTEVASYSRPGYPRGEVGVGWVGRMGGGRGG